MSEFQLKLIIYASNDTLESLELLFPIPMSITHDVLALEHKLSNGSKLVDSNLQRYVILFLESIEKDEDNFYQKLAENPDVISIFHVWNEDSIPTFKQTKMYYIRQDLITVALTYNIIEFLKNEAEKNTQLNQITLPKIYLRKAEKIREWLMSTIRAEPCNILVIPLNTNSTNLIDNMQCLQQYCAKLGYPSAVIRSLDDYIPKSEIYDKLPYGRLVFEYEHPATVCRWLQVLSPIRMYLYGNEQVIPNEWSKQMIANEIDHEGEHTINDDDWCTFLENESIKDEIKWNFANKHGRTWKVTQLTPIKLHTLSDNIRFRSALRRSHITYQSRRSTVTAQIYDWFDKCMELNYIPHEFKLNRRDGPQSSFGSKEEQQSNTLTSRSYTLETVNISSGTDDKIKHTYSLPYSSHQSNELINYYLNKPDRIYVWLDYNFYSIEERFQKLIHPHQWKYFSNVYDCQAFILNQQLQYNPKIYLLTTCTLSEQLFTFEHISKIYAAFLYINQHEVFSQWMCNLPNVRGIYQNLDSLYEKFSFEITTNIELVSTNRQQQGNVDPLPIGFLGLTGEGFKRYRTLTDILFKLPRTVDAKQDMVDELRSTADENGIFLTEIDDFEHNYQSNDAIPWYTRGGFVFRVINRILRSDDMVSIIKYRFFIMDLYEQLSELHKQIICSNSYCSEPTTTTYYRGQLMSLAEIEQFKQNIGNYISINVFFSTTLSLGTALMFAGGSKLEGIASLKPIIFSIEADPTITNTRPYANINSYSTYPEEEEVLFALGCVFHIVKVDVLSGNDKILVIHLKLIDQSDLPQDSFEISELLPEKIILNPIYTLVNLTSLFQTNDQCEHIKSIFEEVDVQFFDNTDDLDHYTKSINTIQSFVIFLRSQSYLPQPNQQTKMISYAENDMHFNDLIYQLLSEMETSKQLRDRINDLYMNIANVYCPAKESNFYVQLLLTSTSKKDSEEQLKTRFSLSTIIPFYQTMSCYRFLQSISEPSKIGNAILILHCDETDIDSLLDKFEQIDSIKHIYLCSKNAVNIKNRRIIHGKFQNEHDLYGQLYSDNLLDSFIQMNQQIDVYKDNEEAKRSLQQTSQYYELLDEYQTQKNIIFE